MKKVLIYSFLVIISMVLSVNDSKAEIKISYKVSFSEPQAHYADVEMRISGINKQYTDLKMPVWAPGSYLVREFGKNVESFSASSANKPVKTEKTDKNTWRIHTLNSDVITVNYRVYSFEISVRTSFIDDSHAFLSPTGIFMYIDGLIKNPSTVSILPYKSWNKISTGLEPVKGMENTFSAPDFDVLYDSPIEVGNQDIFEFNAAGVKHEVAMYGGGNYDKARLSEDMARIVEEETALFKENPNKRYVFIVHNYQNGGGGLEHLNSTVLGAKRQGYSDPVTYKNFLSLVAHEYFHLWNVKRLRPTALGPFNYDQENYTTNLWISEGFTAYYDNLMLRRTDVYSPEKYLDVLCADINLVENQPGNKIQPVSEASFDAWIKYYRPNENSKNSTISYYNKGALIGMLLDLEILSSTGGKKGLDDVMKAMYDTYYKEKKRGFTDAEFRAMAETFAGKPLDKIYNDYVNGTQPINYDSYLGKAGIYAVNENAGKSKPVLGATSQLKEGKLIVTAINRGSAAWTGGLNVNDEIIALDNNRITGVPDTSKMTDLEKAIAAKKVGDKVNILISRDGLIKNIEIPLKANTDVKYRLEIDKDASAEQLAVRKKWLKLQ